MANKITVALLLCSILYLFPSHATLLDTKNFVQSKGNSISFFLLMSLIAALQYFFLLRHALLALTSISLNTKNNYAIKNFCRFQVLHKIIDENLEGTHV